MARVWAEELVISGKLRLSSLEFYRNFEHAEIGDRFEGEGRYAVGNDYAHMGFSYAVFIFCTSLPDTKPEQLFELQSGYDTLIRINNLDLFARAVCNAALEQERMTLQPLIGPVYYDRDSATSYEAIRSKPWGWSAFQKDPKYSHQREYRFAFEHYSTPLPDRPRTEEECLAELLRKHVELRLDLPTGLVELMAR